MDRFLADGYQVIHERDPLYTTGFLSIRESGGVTPVRLSAKSPNLNAYAEKSVRYTNASTRRFSKVRAVR